MSVQDEAVERLGRRRLLTGAGIALGGAGALTLTRVAPAEAAATAVVAVNVKDFGAVGDGTTDDKTAIQNALNDISSSGGAVYFPPGDYVVSGPLVPKSRTLMYGTHTPRWDATSNPAAATKIRCRSNFTGAGLVLPASTTVAVTLRNLALVGAGVGTTVHGLRMPDQSGATGESSWCLEDLTIAGFTGAGIFGRVHVATITGCFVHNNLGWGIDASSGNAWNDVHVANCYVYYNKSGGVYFGGTSTSAAVDWINCRFERGGTNPANVFSPLNSNAPGVRLANAELMLFVNCTTDANTGCGVECVNEQGNYRPQRLLFVNCRFSRDGTGANGSGSVPPDGAGLRVKGVNTDAGSVGPVKCVNCMVTYGKADDAGGGTILGPKYGVWMDYTNYFQWIGGDLDPSPQVSNNAYAGSNNWKPVIVDPKMGLLTLPVDAPTNPVLPDGAAYVDVANSKLKVRVGGVWKQATLT